ncbi:FAD-binding oxidoreductase [Mesorhizobium amorphae]|uniref:NAD(P)/FAD-dependent oxidoreductase n=1 Tax=Mesorhizobium amorphae TaxID=71433 RepID=UPI003ECE2340
MQRNIINGAFDAIAVGAGMSGISCAYALAKMGLETLVIDQTATPPEHSSARSVALYSKSYAPSTSISAIIAASEEFLRKPTLEFDSQLLIDRPTVHVFNDRDSSKGLDLFNEMGNFPARDQIRPIRKAELLDLVPIFKSDYPLAAILETGSGDLDPHAMWSGFRRGHKSNGGQLVARTGLVKATYYNGEWTVETTSGTFVCRTLINAAGAWGDEVAIKCGVKPIGLQPCNRTALVAQSADGQCALATSMPFVFLPFDDLYFRVNAGMITMSPADATPAPPCDAQPEEYDIARTMAKFEEVSKVRLAPQKPKSWAGQRTFTVDKDPAVGFDPEQPGFLWLVGQGGFGIESAWTLANIAAAIIADKNLPDEFTSFGLKADTFSPKRFRMAEVA